VPQRSPTPAAGASLEPHAHMAAAGWGIRLTRSGGAVNQKIGEPASLCSCSDSISPWRSASVPSPGASLHLRDSRPGRRSDGQPCSLPCFRRNPFARATPKTVAAVSGLHERAASNLRQAQLGAWPPNSRALQSQLCPARFRRLTIKSGDEQYFPTSRSLSASTGA